MAGVGLEENSLILGKAAQSAGTSTVDGDPLDMAGYDGVIVFGTIATANAGNFLKLQGGEAANLSDAADLAGSKVIADANGQVVGVDIVKPKERYLRGSIVRGVSTATGDLYYLRYHSHKQPEANQITNVLKTIKLASPAEGTP